MELSGTFEAFLPENKDLVVRPILGLNLGAMYLYLNHFNGKCLSDWNF